MNKSASATCPNRVQDVVHYLHATVVRGLVLALLNFEMPRFVTRFIGAALLRPETYEDVEADNSALGQAIAVVLLSSIAAGVGSWGAAAGRPIVLTVIIVVALLVWLVWAYLTYEIGARLMPTARTQADVGQLLRTLGFASAPGVLRIFGIIPGRHDARVRRHRAVDADGDGRRHSAGARLHKHSAGRSSVRAELGARCRARARHRHAIGSCTLMVESE